MGAGKCKILVSLPDNDPALARAALAGGADGLKVHINVTHRVTRRTFGSWYEERGRIAAIVAASPVPVTVMAGSDTVATPVDLHDMAEMGVHSLDLYIHHMPAYMLAFSARMDIIAALSHTYTAEEIGGLAAMDAVKAIEASIVPPDEYGRPLNLRDLALYRSIVDMAGKPVIVPTQRQVVPDDVPLLIACGVQALLIGGIVTGGDAAGIEHATAAFKQAAAGVPV